MLAGLYGKEIDAKEILAGQVKSPAGAKAVIDVLTKYPLLPAVVRHRNSAKR